MVTYNHIDTSNNNNNNSNSNNKSSCLIKKGLAQEPHCSSIL